MRHDGGGSRKRCAHLILRTLKDNKETKMAESLFSRMKRECPRFDFIRDYPWSHREFSRIKDVYENTEFLKAVHDDICKDCILREDCKLISYRHFVKKNVIVNNFNDMDREVIVFKKPLICLDDVQNAECGGKSNYVDIDGVLVPRNENTRYSKWLENMDRSADQSLDRFYGYALSNKWDYFITLTTDPKKVNRYDDEAVRALWRECRRTLQRFDKDVRILLSLERHGDNALHFHGLVGMERQWAMKLAFNPRTGKQMYSGAGSPLFEFPFWKYGMATCAIIDFGKPGDEPDLSPAAHRRRVTNYLVKYVTKNFGVEYRKRRFYHTLNLSTKTKEVLNLSAEEIEERCTGMTVYKETEDFIILRQEC